MAVRANDDDKMQVVHSALCLPDFVIPCGANTFYIVKLVIASPSLMHVARCHPMKAITTLTSHQIFFLHSQFHVLGWINTSSSELLMEVTSPGQMTDYFILVLFQDEETETLLSADFEIGHFIRERIVPRAVLYFTGEAIEDDEVRYESRRLC